MAKEIIIKCKWFSGTVTGGGVLIQNGKSGLVGRAGGGQKERSHSSPTWISILFFSICMGGLLSDTRYLRWWALRQAPGIHWASQPWGWGALGRERAVPGSSSCVGLEQTAGHTRCVVLCCVRGGRPHSGLQCAGGSRGARWGPWCSGGARCFLGTQMLPLRAAKWKHRLVTLFWFPSCRVLISPKFWGEALL